jgi:hypothetical protein
MGTGFGEVCGAAGVVVAGTEGEGFAGAGAVCPTAKAAAKKAALKLKRINRIVCMLFLRKKMCAAACC